MDLKFSAGLQRALQDVGAKDLTKLRLIECLTVLLEYLNLFGISVAGHSKLLGGPEPCQVHPWLCCCQICCVMHVCLRENLLAMFVTMARCDLLTVDL